MGFIEDERKRRENLARESASDTPAKKSRERLLRATAELKREELYAKSEAYFGESFTPKLIDQLSEVVGGTVSVSRDQYDFGWNNPTKRYYAHQKGEIWLRLDWDEKPAPWPYGSNLRARFRETKFDPSTNRFSICKSIGIIFYPSGSIRFNGGHLNGISGSSEITYAQWKGNKATEEASLQRAFKIPGEYLVQVNRRQSEGGPTSESIGPGSL